MGLDISTKNDYARFSWSGASHLIKWSDENLGLSPFPNWDGGNGTVVVFNKKKSELGEREIKGSKRWAKMWIREFEKYAKKIGDETLLTLSKGQLIGEIAWRVAEHIELYTLEQNEIETDEVFSHYTKEQREWQYIQAIKWYFVIQDGLENGIICYF